MHPQRGEDFATRLVNAHLDAAAASDAPVVQVGMDTPHLEARTLTEVGARLTHPDAAVLGPASDGGWWLLGVGSPAPRPPTSATSRCRPRAPAS